MFQGAERLVGDDTSAVDTLVAVCALLCMIRGAAARGTVAKEVRAAVRTCNPCLVERSPVFDAT